MELYEQVTGKVFNKEEMSEQQMEIKLKEALAKLP
jgi:hypothetical protein